MDKIFHPSPSQKLNGLTLKKDVMLIVSHPYKLQEKGYDYTGRNIAQV